MNSACLPSFMGAVPAAALARSPAPANVSGEQAAAEFTGLIAALLASAMPAVLEGTADPTASGSGGKSKANPGVAGKTPKAAKKQPSVPSGLAVPTALPATAAAPLLSAELALPVAKNAPAKGDLAAAAPSGASAGTGADSNDPGTDLAQAPASALAAALTAAALIPLLAVAPAASPAPAQPNGSPGKPGTQEAQVPAAPVAPAPSPALPAAAPAQPQSAARDASPSPSALQATAPEEAPPSPAKPPAEKTELAFAARLTEQTSQSAASNGSSQAATSVKEDGLAIPASQSATEAASLASRSSRTATSKAPEKAASENTSGTLEPAAARLDTSVPAAPGSLQRTAVQPVTATKETTVAAPLDLEPAGSQTGPQPVRQLSLVIPQTASDGGKPETVEVRLLDSGGQVHVAVRSADPGLNQSLGGQLGDLVTQLEHSGYRAETWRPAVSAAVAGGVSAVAGTSAQHLRGGAEQEGSSGSGRGNQDGDAGDSSKRQRRDQEQARPQWLDLLEESGSTQIKPERTSIHGFST